MRAAAIETLGQVAEKGDRDVIVAATALLKDREGAWSKDVRAAAIKPLGQVAEKGDRDVIVALTARLQDQDSGWMINTGWPLIEG